MVDGLDSKSSALGHVGSSPTAPTEVMGTYQRLPLKIIRGKGCWVWDETGKVYLDAVAGIASCSLGHSNRKLRHALNRQLNQIQHVSNLYRINEQEELAKWLVSRSCADSVFFCNSGTEANEAAIKLSRKYGHFYRKIKNPLILTAQSSFHGRTLASLSATGQPKYHQGFEPLVEGFIFFPYNDINEFENLLQKIESKGPKVASVLIEPLQGEGGIQPGEISFFKRVRKLCDKYKILLILDEVQVGMGRSGKWWGYQNLGIEPDAFTLAKGLGGGHAIGALLAKSHADVFEPGDHASTFGGNPFACKAGLTVAKEIERLNLLENASRRGEELNRGLKELVKAYPKELKEVRGWGLLQGLVLHEASKITTKKFIQIALEQKLLVISAGPNVIRIVPPLIINSRETKIILKRIQRTIERLI